MAGLVKAKKYDWKDSNLALFGSDTEKQVKKESAESEPAWQGAGTEVGLKIWRVVKFQIEEWPEEQYGEFYNGDSYIILNTYKKEESDELLYDVHFWIGEFSTQDEYGTAAYKTVELDTFLDDKPIQHREVMKHESELFKSYFDTLTLLKGGADSGFRRVPPEEYTPRLFHVRKVGRRVEVNEVARAKENISSDDVFILDLGSSLIQWNGANCSHDEKFKAAGYMQQLESERNGRAQGEVVEEGEGGRLERQFLGALDQNVDEEDDGKMPEENVLFKVSDEDGSLDSEEVKREDISQDDFSTSDVFLFLTKTDMFVWVGDGASIDEKRNGFSYAHQYLKNSDFSWLPITVLAERDAEKCTAFQSALAA